MNEFKYTGEIEDEEDDEKIPEVKQNELSEKFTIGVAIAIALWIFVFMMLGTIGIISGLVMRICIYPVVVGILIAYVIVKYKKNRF